MSRAVEVFEDALIQWNRMEQKVKELVREIGETGIIRIPWLDPRIGTEELRSLATCWQHLDVYDTMSFRTL